MSILTLRMLPSCVASTLPKPKHGEHSSYRRERSTAQNDKCDQHSTARTGEDKKGKHKQDRAMGAPQSLTPCHPHLGRPYAFSQTLLVEQLEQLEPGYSARLVLMALKLQVQWQ